MRASTMPRRPLARPRLPEPLPGLAGRGTRSDAVAQQPPYVSQRAASVAHEVIARDAPCTIVPLWAHAGSARGSRWQVAARPARRLLARDHAAESTSRWFRNHGALAGASQPHSHAQIVGGAVIPARVLEMTRRMGAWASSHSRDLLGAMVDRDLADGARVIGRVGDVVVVAPYAPAASWEQWLVPLEGGPRFHEASAATVAQLADAMEAALRALYTVARRHRRTTPSCTRRPVVERPASDGMSGCCRGASRWAATS
jgi:hypothetical protein